MLSKDRFTSAIAYISAFYTNFKFDLKDDDGKPSFQFNVWFDAFKDFNEEEFIGIIKRYCKENVYPPSSPAQILEYARTLLYERSMTPDEAWEYAIRTIRGFGFSRRDFQRLYTHLEERNLTVILKTLKEMESEFHNLLSDQLPFVKRNFVKAYESNLKIGIRETVAQGRLENNANKQLSYVERKEEK